ncbi:hypothetical protein ABT095_33650 [Kitasatospora sp. NPDC002227]|uniref:hypothetical protein n=1 Tax=Kitasatospora sp. NPDC002227 TaxID=3154773 RepID=UPI0033206E35
MSVRFVISDPPPPTWWAKNKVVVSSIAGVLLGLWFGGGFTGSQAATCPTVNPSPTATSSPTGH